MMSYDINPFSEQDRERQEIWSLLVQNQIEAGLKLDFNLVRSDYDQDGFVCIDANGINHADAWIMKAADLSGYALQWTQKYKAIKANAHSSDLRAALYRSQFLGNLQILEGTALVRLGTLHPSAFPDSGSRVYTLKRTGGDWKIRSVIEHLPVGGSEGMEAGKFLPPNAVQHKTAGPYSPVLKVNPGRLVVISGQAPVDLDGVVRGDTIEDQTALTLENCRKQLNIAGVDFEDVFKVNVYLTDLDLWPRFNVIYRKIMPQPFPVRTAIGCALLGFLVEIEMWAASQQ